MKRYVALLRGINVSGKNKISMAELKSCFIKSGYENVRTHLNSGNVLFLSDKEKNALRKEIEILIEQQFGLEIPVFVEEIDIIKEELMHAPSWWGSTDKEIYDNLIFVFPEKSAKEIETLVGEPTEDIEQIEIYKDVIFWSFDLKKHAKANWWKKTASTGIGEYLTIRTANTVRKIVELSDK